MLFDYKLGRQPKLLFIFGPFSAFYGPKTILEPFWREGAGWFMPNLLLFIRRIWPVKGPNP